jgi:protein phosphatase 2C
MYYHTKSLLGRRDKNEDEISIILNYDGNDTSIKKMNFFAVFDGHGGPDISKYVADKMYRFFVTKYTRNIDFNKKSAINRYIIDVFNQLQSRIEQFKRISESCGTTALVVMQLPDRNGVFCKLKIINLGDCRAVLCTNDNIANPLTRDHKPMNYDENNRIRKLDTEIVHDKDDDPRVNGYSVSRALGDVSAKPGISHIPDIFDYRLSVSRGKITDKFLILACDGVWDVLSNQEAVDFVLFKLKENHSKENQNTSSNKNIAYDLAKYAIDKDSGDNISIIIVFFN